MSSQFKKTGENQHFTLISITPIYSDFDVENPMFANAKLRLASRKHLKAFEQRLPKSSMHSAKKEH